MGSTKYGPTPRLGVRQKTILGVVKSTPINVYHLRNKLKQWPHSGTKITVSEIERSLDGLQRKGLVKNARIPVYGEVLQVTPKGRAIAARKGVLA